MPPIMQDDEQLDYAGGMYDDDLYPTYEEIAHVRVIVALAI